MPQDLRTRCGKEASHRGQRRCPPLTGRPGRALHPEACPPCPGLRWGARCMAPGAGAGWDPGADTWPHRRPRADSCALGYSRLDQGAASEPFAAGRPQRRAPRGRASAVLSGAQNARGQISRGRSSPTRPWIVRAGIPAPGGPACCPRARAACKRSEIPHALREGRCLTLSEEGRCLTLSEKGDGSRCLKKADASRSPRSEMPHVLQRSEAPHVFKRREMPHLLRRREMAQRLRRSEIPHVRPTCIFSSEFRTQLKTPKMAVSLLSLEPSYLYLGN